MVSYTDGRTQEEVDNSVFGRIFGREDEVTGGGKKLHNEAFLNLYLSPHIITMIKSRCLRWAGNLGVMREIRNAFKIFVGRLKKATIQKT